MHRRMLAAADTELATIFTCMEGHALQLGKTAPFKMLADPTKGLCLPVNSKSSLILKCQDAKVMAYEHENANCAKTSIDVNGTDMTSLEFTCEQKLVSGFMVETFSDVACKTSVTKLNFGIPDNTCMGSSPNVTVSCGASLARRNLAVGTKVTVQAYDELDRGSLVDCAAVDKAEKYVLDSGKCTKDSDMAKPSMASAASLSMVAASAFAIVASLIM